MIVWTKRISAHLEESWRAKLAWLPDECVVTSGHPSSPTWLSLQAFGVDQGQAESLKKAHGGAISTVDETFLTQASQGATKPLRVKDQLLIANSPEAEALARDQFPGRKVIVIPPGMAFGTGEHATTLTAARRLAELALAYKRAGTAWTCCDAGCGTGVLSIAAELLGAASVDAFDFDPVAVEVAVENAAANSCARIRLFTQDVLDWTPPAAGYDVVLANIYGPVLIQAMPVLKRAVAPGGTLILSGILRSQAESVWAAATAHGLTLRAPSRVGKWVTGVLN